MNANLTNTSVGPCPADFAFFSEDSRRGQVVSLTLQGILSLVGNLLVIGVLYKNRDMRTVTNVFIANMAVSDLIFPLVVLPKEIARRYTGGYWLVHGVFGNLLCKAVHFLQDVSTAVSLQSHLAISFERFYAVMFPLRARQSNNCCRIFTLVLTWLSAMCFYVPYFITFRLVPFRDGYMCIHDWEPIFGIENTNDTQKKFFLTYLSVNYIIPLCVIIGLYTVLFMKLRRRKVIGQDFARREAREEQQKRHIVKLAATIVFCFAILWAPMHVFYILYIFKWHLRLPCGLMALHFSVFYIAWLNSATNPIIYFIYSHNYRNGLRNLIRGILAFGSRLGPHNSVGIEPTMTAISSELRETSRGTPRQLRRKMTSPELSVMRPQTGDSHPGSGDHT